MPGVKSRTGKSRSTIYKECAEGLFPKPVPLGRRAVGWPENEVDDINVARVSGATDDQIRRLVTEIMEKRRHLSRACFADSSRPAGSTLAIETDF